VEDNNYWNCSTTITAGEKHEVEELNIWDYKWLDTRDHFVKKEPVRESTYTIVIYEIKDKGKTIRFGAAEVSNSVWLIYTHYK
jgi:hypothetical protein